MANQQQKSKGRHCPFCVQKDLLIDYKNTDILRRYLSSFAKIVPRKRSGLCSSHQRQMGNEIKKSRIMALLPFVQE